MVHSTRMWIRTRRRPRFHLIRAEAVMSGDDGSGDVRDGIRRGGCIASCILLCSFRLGCARRFGMEETNS